MTETSLVPTVPTWIGAWAIRAAVVVIGVLICMFAFSLFGLSKVDSPFHDWSSFTLFVGISLGVCLLLLIEAFVEHKGWIVEQPKKIESNIEPPSFN